MLETVDLDELESLQVDGANDRPGAASQVTAGVRGTFKDAKSRTLTGLLRARQAFHGEPETTEVAAGPHAQAAVAAASTDSQAQSPEAAPQKLETLLRSISLAEAVGDRQAIVRATSEALALGGLEPITKANLLLKRGAAYYFQGEGSRARGDWSDLIDLPDAPIAHVAVALNNRALAYRDDNDPDAALQDCTRLIESLPGAPVEQVARALISRGVLHGRGGPNDQELQDYTRVIESLPDAPVAQIALALVNRGVAFGIRGESERELQDYTRVIESLPDAPVEEVARALVNRGD
jgi:tetratricopeptide (TPR) repeat protein